MKRIFLRLKQPLRNERGEITFFACFFVVGIVMLISFLLLYASIRITCINIRNGAKMELNNLSGTIYADTYRSQRETNFEEYLNTLYSSSDYTDMLEATVAGGLDSKISLSTEDYKVSNISLEFNVEDGTAEESSVSTVRAIFFDASEQLTDDIELTGVEAGNPGQPNGGVSKPFKVDAKSKRILIIANPGAGFPAKGSFGTGASYSTVNGVLALSLGADVTQNVAKNGSFMM
jgi:hypothetical protein